jgi:putative ABC transport system permease protein
MMYSLLEDLRYGVRMLIKNPGFTAIALITLALGVGVNTAMFSFINAMRIVPQRFAEPDEVVFLWSTRERQDRNRLPVDALDCLDWREQATVFANLALFNQRIRVLTRGGEPERLVTVQATANLVPMLGFDAQIGRVHRVEEDTVGAERVALLSDRFWQRRFDRKVDILGQTITLDDQPFTVIGVLPPQLDFEQLIYRKIDLLTPLPLDPAQLKRGRFHNTAMARLRPGISVEQAQAEMTGIAARLAKAYPDTNEGIGVWIQPLGERLFSAEDRLASLALLAAVGCVLLIACVNLANLLLAKASSRGREFAVRAALGAGRTRIVRQLLTESLLLALLGGALGTLVGVWAVDLFAASQPSLPFRQEELGLHPAVLTYALVLSAVAALVFGLGPALTASKISLHEALKEGEASSAGRSRNRLRNTLVTGQLAITLPLIICAGLVIRHIIALKTVDVGFNTNRLLVMQIDLPGHRYESDLARATFFGDATDAIKSTPGVESAASVNLVPLGGARASVSVVVEGREVEEGARPDYVGYLIVTPGYFTTMEIPLISGRFFSDHDHAKAPRVAIVNQQMATKYWPNDDAVGKRFKTDPDAPDEPWTMVIGVVGDVGHSGLYQPLRPELFLPHRQEPRANMVVVARTLGEPMAQAQVLQGQIRRMDPDQPIYGVRTMKDIIHRWLRDDRMAVWCLSGLAVLALGLASVGLYGVVSFSVARRTHEIGIRVALGAEDGDVFRLVLGRSLKLALVGTGVGLLLSIGVGLALQSQLYGVNGIDPGTFAAVSMLLLGVATAAGYLPARRATKVDPMVALRCE